MKDMTDKEVEELTRFLADLPLMLGEVVGECIRHGVETETFSDNTAEVALMIEAWIGEEIQMCEEIAGRPPTREEITSALSSRVIKYAKQKKHE